MDSSFTLFTAFALQLFIIVDPIAGVPVFLAITPDNTRAQRRVMAVRGCLAAFAILVFFLLGGRLLMGYFAIETSAVRICGGLLLFVISLEMLYGRPTGTGTSPREERLAEAKADISITPPALLAASALVFVVTGLLLLRADALLRFIGALGAAIVTRLMGLVLAFLAVQYVIDGIRGAFGP